MGLGVSGGWLPSKLEIEDFGLERRLRESLTLSAAELHHAWSGCEEFTLSHGMDG